MMPYIYIVIPSYMLMAIIGLFFAIGLVYFRIEKYEVAFSEYMILIVWAAVGLVIGSKLLFAITQIPWLIDNFSITNLLLLIPTSGFVFYGGLIGMLIAIVIYTRKTEKDTAKYLRLIAPAIPLFHGFGRIGCFLTGCCYGKSLSPHWHVLGVEFDKIPVQLIESAFEFVLFVVLLIVSRKAINFNTIYVYLISYASFRFVIEFFRGDTIRGIILGLSTSQWISIAIVVFVVYKRVFRKRSLAV